MDYQASPLNYQENSEYLRSFATSYAKALQDTLPGDYPTSKFFLTRSGDFDQVLDKFFEVLKVTSRDLNVGTVKSGLAKTIAKAADYLYTNDEDLNNYWEVPGNPQAFVDVTSLLKATTDATLHQQITEELGNLVKRALAEGIAEELAHKEVKKSHASLGNKDQTALKDDIARGLKTHVA